MSATASIFLACIGLAIMSSFSQPFLPTELDPQATALSGYFVGLAFGAVIWRRGVTS